MRAYFVGFYLHQKYVFFLLLYFVCFFSFALTSYYSRPYKNVTKKALHFFVVLILFDLVVICQNKEIVWRAIKNLAQRIYRFIFNGARFVVDHFIEILITHSELNIEPIF